MKHRLLNYIFSAMLLLLFHQSQAQRMEHRRQVFRHLQTPDLSEGQLWDDLPRESQTNQYRWCPGFRVGIQGEYFDTLSIGQGIVSGFSRHAIFNAGLHADLCDRGLATGQHLSPIRCSTTGAAGRRIAVVEWQNAGFYEEWSYKGTLNDSVNLQVWFFESDGHAEIHFGRGTYHGQAGLRTGIIFSKRTPKREIRKWICMAGDKFKTPDTLCRQYMQQLPRHNSVYRFAWPETGTLAALPVLEAVDGKVVLSDSGRVTVYSAAGSRLLCTESPQTDVVVAGLEPGLYILEISYSHGAAGRARLLVR